MSTGKVSSCCGAVPAVCPGCSGAAMLAVQLALSRGRGHFDLRALQKTKPKQTGKLLPPKPPLPQGSQVQRAGPPASGAAGREEEEVRQGHGTLQLLLHLYLDRLKCNQVSSTQSVTECVRGCIGVDEEHPCSTCSCARMKAVAEELLPARSRHSIWPFGTLCTLQRPTSPPIPDGSWHSLLAPNAVCHSELVQGTSLHLQGAT